MYQNEQDQSSRNLIQLCDSSMISEDKQHCKSVTDQLQQYEKDRKSQEFLLQSRRQLLTWENLPILDKKLKRTHKVENIHIFCFALASNASEPPCKKHIQEISAFARL